MTHVLRQIGMSVSAAFILSTAASLAANVENDIASPPIETQAESELPCVSKTVEVEAPIDKVWSAIQARRTSDPAKRKLISYDGKTAVVKEQFPAMPIIGSSDCTYSERERSSDKSIDYKLINSDHFKIFQGSWHLLPGRKPGTTLVTLTSTLDPGVRVPFWTQMAKMNMAKDVRTNIQEVVSLACSKGK